MRALLLAAGIGKPAAAVDRHHPEMPGAGA